MCRCGWSGPAEDALHAPDPFNEGEALHACPGCKQQTLECGCDEEGCTSVATMGCPTPGGYRWTCWRHYPDHHTTLAPTPTPTPTTDQTTR